MSPRFLLLTAAMLCVVLIGQIALAQTTPGWQRHTLSGGGVCHDLEMAQGYATHLDPVWASCGNNGAYRAEWTDQNGWGNWTEYLTGKYVFGVDVIVKTLTWTEYVLTASGNFGVHYNTSTTGTFSNVWERPNGLKYPDDWNTVATHDVAFYHDNTSGPWPETPEDSFYVVLNEIVDPLGNSKNPGLYFWNTTLTPDNFERFDAENNDDHPQYFDHFWRDLSDKNKLWIVKKLDENTTGALYRLSGGYGEFPEEPIEIVDNLQEIYGISQWYTEDPAINLLYVLVKWIEASEEKYGVFTLDLNNGNQVNQIYNLPEALCTTPMDDIVYMTGDILIEV